MAKLANAHGSGSVTLLNLFISSSSQQLSGIISYEIHLGERARPSKNYGFKKQADMAKLANAHGSGPCERKFLQVQVLLSAPKKLRLLEIIGKPFIVMLILFNHQYQAQHKLQRRHSSFRSF